MEMVEVRVLGMGQAVGAKEEILLVVVIKTTLDIRAAATAQGKQALSQFDLSSIVISPNKCYFFKLVVLILSL